MNNELTLPWILEGYRLFAHEGPKALKIEVMAKKMGKSKSSFYYHFIDMELFIQALLDYHLSRAEIIGERERQCKNVDPELFKLLIEIKEDLLFSRQLRINRRIVAYKECFEKVNEIIGDAIVIIWSEAIGLNYNSNVAKLILGLTMENFYLQITPETLSYEWLRGYLEDVKTMITEFQDAEKKKNH
ncbi:TetR/AcrR family transcriptional regulator [uncultured Croceitalea sp.]|uniref:TetR/AcrR family transcriptional regulator n=1 Tax=uncultured Croceitalea sp. TaxID=1798908 RepID=UPI003305AEAC